VVDGFTLEYTFGAPGTITDDMLEELRVTTESHLDDFLRDNYQGRVLFAFAELSLDALVPPNEVQFTPTLNFFEGSDIPSDAALRNAVQASFLGSFAVEYIASLRDLPSSNVFSSVTGVMFMFTPTDSPTSSPVEATQSILPEVPTFTTPNSGGDNGGSSAGVLLAAGAGAFVLVAAGYVVYRRRSEESEPVGKFVDPDGHMTVTGDTFMESTTAGGQSMDSGSAASPSAFRNETLEWREYHSDQERIMMSEAEWEEYQDVLERSDSPCDTIQEEDVQFDEDENLPDRVLAEMDQMEI
jgi:hypothetical protein